MGEYLPSALQRRLEQHLRLTPGERAFLATLEAREQRFSAGERLMQPSRPNDALWVLRFGWLHSSVELPSGARQILRFHYPGDLVGLSGIAWSYPATTLTVVSDCIVSEVAKPAIGQLFRDEPRLAGLLYAMAAAETVALGDRLVSVGRMDAQARLTTLLLDMLARLRVTAGGVVDSFDLPLTQQDIGDAAGLTKVHVSRTLGAMETAGLIERRGRRMRILKEAEMAAAVGFVDRYAVIQTDWLPLTG